MEGVGVERSGVESWKGRRLAEAERWKGKERKVKERKGKERKGKERKGKERKGKGKKGEIGFWRRAGRSIILFG